MHITRPQHLIFVGFALIILSLILDFKFPRPTIAQVNNNHSSAFHGRDIVDPLVPPSPDAYREISLPSFTFYSESPAQAQDAMISFRYSCQPECPQLWLELQNQPSAVSPRFAVYHPQLAHLRWFSIYRNNFFLYQQQLTYRTVDQFLTQLPDQPFAVDPAIAQVLQISSPKMISSEDPQITSNAKYILTTYQHPRQHHGWNKFTRGLNLAQAQRDSSNRLMWHLKSIGESPETKIFITYPEIDYR